MWSSLFIQKDEFGRGAASASGAGAGGGKAAVREIFGKRRAQESELNKSQRGKVKLVFFVALVGVTLSIFGVSTDYWVELAPPKRFYGNETCLVAHYGLWKGCVRRLWLYDINPNRESCGPAGLPGGDCMLLPSYSWDASPLGKDYSGQCEAWQEFIGLQ